MTPLAEPSDTTQAALQELIKRCAEETQGFFNKLNYDPHYCYRLFRLALIEDNRTAWEAIYAQYYPMVLAWVRSHIRFNDIGEDADVFGRGDSRRRVHPHVQGRVVRVGEPAVVSTRASAMSTAKRGKLLKTLRPIRRSRSATNQAIIS